MEDSLNGMDCIVDVNLVLRREWRDMIAVLKWAASKKCNKKNCGTVCKCESCMARSSLAFFDPEWRA